MPTPASAVDPGAPQAVEQPGRSSSSPDRRWLLVAMVVALPILVLVAALAQQTWYPTGDQAQAELRMRSLPDDPPLVGAAGRIADEEGRQGNHPGPLMFWATWPLYALLGGSSWAFEAATALVNVAWLAVAVWLVKRRAGLGSCAWFGIVALVLIGGFGLDGLSQPWNPWVALLPFTVLLLSTWSALEGARWAPVLATAAGSYALQGHVGYLPLVVPLVGVALAAPIWRWWRGGSAPVTAPATPKDSGTTTNEPTAERPPPSRWLWPLVASVAVAALAWSGPIWDVLTNDPHNVDKLIANFASPSEDPIGIGRGVEAVLQSAAPLGAWVWGGSAVEGAWWPGLLLLAAWAVVAVVVAVRRAQPSLTRLNLVLAGSALIGVVAVSRIFGALYLYTFRWITVIVALQVFALGWGLAVLVPRPSPTTVRRLAGGAVVVLLALSAATAVRVSRQEIPYDQSNRAVAGLVPDVADALDPDTRYLVRWDDPAYLGGLGFGLILDLERRGFDVGGEPRFDAAIEPQRVRCPGDYDALLTVVTGERNIERFVTEHPDAEQVAAVDPRTDPAEWEERFAELVGVLGERSADGTTPDAESVEGTMNLLLLAPGQPEEVTDLAAYLVLDGVPSAAFLEDPAPDEVLDPNPLNEPCFP